MILKIFLQSLLLLISILIYANSHLVPMQDSNDDLIQPPEEEQYPEVVRVLLADFMYYQAIQQRLRSDYTHLFYRRN